MKFFSGNENYGKTYSIGIIRSDGDLDLLATLNNSSNLIDAEKFEKIKNELIKNLTEATEDEIVCLEREDALDVVILDDDILEDD